tara:strand:+ start:306 stop:611 length:306 start_codon:yes stop_codon:yes gene_type:complete
MENIKEDVFNEEMKENDYLQMVNELKKQYDERQSEIDKNERHIEFLHEEIVKIFGTLKMLSTACKDESLTVNILMNFLQLIENRCEFLYHSLILEDIPLED